jgi:hypothetical protein
MVRTDVLVEPKLILPLIVVVPKIVVFLLTVRVPPLATVTEPNVTVTPVEAIFNIEPAFTVTEPAAVWVILAAILTELAPVVAIITLSPVAGTTPPTHVEAVAHAPPVAVLVMVAA